MDRRKFLLGAGSVAIGGSALLGSGAFSRVESQRAVDIKVAHDSVAYVGLEQKETPNSQNYTGYDDKGHFYIDIADQGGHGEGINSNSRNFFDDLFTICNNGKETAEFCIDSSQLTYELPEDWDDENQNDPEDVIVFYKGTAAGSQGLTGIEEIMCHDVDKDVESQSLVLETGECQNIGLLVNTRDSSIPASTTITGEVIIEADTDTDVLPPEEEVTFTTTGRIRNGSAGGWQIAAGNVTTPGQFADSRPGLKTSEWADFEFEYDGDGTYTTRAEDAAGDMASVSHTGPAPPSNWFRVLARGNDVDPSRARNIEINGTSLDDLEDDAEAFPSTSTTAVDLSDGFTVTGEYRFDLAGSVDERPALDFQIEGPP